MPSKAKSKKSRAVSSGKKSAWGKVKSLSFGKRLTLVVVGVLLLTAVGSAGYFKYKEQELKAEAANWKLLTTTSTGAIWGCREGLLSNGWVPVKILYQNKRGGWLPTTYITGYDARGNLTGNASQRYWFWSVSAMKGIVPYSGDVYAAISGSARRKVDVNYLNYC